MHNESAENVIYEITTESRQSCKEVAGMRVPPVRKVYHFVRSSRKVLTFNQQISAKSARTRNKKPILNDIIYIFCNLKAVVRIILRNI